MSQGLLKFFATPRIIIIKQTAVHFNSKATMGKSKQVQVHQVFDIRYYDGVKMQRILEGLFPERKGSFGLRMTNDQWAFRAPRQVTRDELAKAEIPQSR
ncbi:uncharacterized protein FPRO_07090 [Fusarium proliferatum ET1]|uniref:Uncharacterized protein n=1 Tax=Fusarium proliferatum (strain ET1) TaxID=1227346 RepID=A0A1L7VAC9_FUSPR|nr:uncharacterized protein FPRO_07090 [Fusarium proliferatum ET1]CZR37719.1 uncharacterized protein FPRO_07090 [Fusarium proliferatum ET1]